MAGTGANASSRRAKHMGLTVLVRVLFETLADPLVPLATKTQRVVHLYEDVQAFRDDYSRAWIRGYKWAGRGLLEKARAAESPEQAPITTYLLANELYLWGLTDKEAADKVKRFGIVYNQV